MTSALVLPLQSLRDPSKPSKGSLCQRGQFVSCFVLLKIQKGAVSQPWVQHFVFQTRRLRVSFLFVLLKAAVTFISPLAFFPGFFLHQLGTGHGLRRGSSL